MLLTKDFITEQEPVTLQDPDLLAIRKYAKRDVEPSEVWCGAFKVCNTLRDRSGEKFTKAYLERFAETLPGKSLLEGHRRDIRALGRFYGAEVLPDGADWYLKGYYYTRADSPIVPEIELGIAKDCSIGYAAGKRTCSIDGKMWLPFRQGECKEHQPLQEYDGQECTIHYCDTEAHKAEAQEVSLVWMGCQYGAEATAKTYLAGITEEQRRFFALGAGYLLDPPAPHTEESGMNKTVEELEAEVKRLSALPLAADRETELVKQIAELETKADALEAKAPLADDGAKYRAHLKEEIGRVAGLLGKSATYTTLLEHMKDAGSDSLQPVLKELLDEYDLKNSGGTGRTDIDPDAPNGAPKKTSLLGRLATGGYW